MKIAIPSYKRHETIQKKTLRVLQEYDIDPSMIEVFVNDQEPGEHDRYKEALSKNEYTNRISIVKGVPTIGAQRNFIEMYYPEGTKLMMIDDDIEEVQRRESEKKLVRVENLLEVFNTGFEEMESVGSAVWGVYAASNPFFMKERVQTKLCLMVASMFGQVVDHDPNLRRVTNHGEDSEFSIRQYMKHGTVARLDWITVKTKYYTEPGGLQGVRTQDYMVESMSKIVEMFPDLCTMYYRKTTGFPEIRFNDQSGGKYQKTNTESALWDFFS